MFAEYLQQHLDHGPQNAIPAVTGSDKVTSARKSLSWSNRVCWLQSSTGSSETTGSDTWLARVNEHATAGARWSSSLQSYSKWHCAVLAS
ncbi:hypothetical protein ABBQ38_002580 [Trebouxia sp. C0009 RCD-2024]